jgi:hypothetical protein
MQSTGGRERAAQIAAGAARGGRDEGAGENVDTSWQLVLPR